jgi:hypothetical protein
MADSTRDMRRSVYERELKPKFGSRSWPRSPTRICESWPMPLWIGAHWQLPMSATFHRLANTDFCASHQPLLSGSDLPSVASSNYRIPNGGILSVRTQSPVLFSCTVSLKFALRGRNSSCIVAGHCLTLRSSGTCRKRHAPELSRYTSPL